MAWSVLCNVSSGTIEQRIQQGHMARSPVLSPDGDIFTSATGWKIPYHLSMSFQQGKRTVQTIKEPYSMVSGDGAFLLVANMIRMELPLIGDDLQSLFY